MTPEHVVPQILEALPHAIDAGLRLPIVYNTSSYDSLDSLALMDGIVDVYMPDAKVWSRERARRFLRMPAEILRWIAGTLGPDTYVDLMAQYYPAGLVGRTDVRDPYQEINRHLHQDEFVRAVKLADELGLRRLDRRSVASGNALAT